MRTVASLRSSFFADRLRAGLWLFAVAVAIALVVAVVVGFRPRAENPNAGRRVAVAEYIVRVGRIQVAMAEQVRGVDRSYKAFAKKPESLAARVAEYHRAERTLAKLRDRLARVTAPADARRLRRLLVRLADQNVAMAGAVTGLASYLPSLADAQAPLRDEVATLRSAVAASKTATGQAAAFEAYAAAGRRIATNVSNLDAPALFEGARDAEAGQLRKLASLAAGIADALRAKQVERAQNLVANLAQVQGETSVVRAQRAAAVAYNAELAKITATAKAVEIERRRLERRVPES